MNLWADDDTNNNEHLAPEETVSRRQKGRLSEQAILSSLRSWLLADYIPSYSHALAALRLYRRCYWVDAWGGQLASTLSRKTSISTSSMPTAPVVKGRKKEVPQESRPIALHSLVLEAGSSTRKNGKVRQNGNGEDTKNGSISPATTNTAFTLPKEGGMIRASWQEAGSTLLKEIDQSPAIFLLNPFGPTLFHYDDLALLYQRAAPTELCLLISQKQAETQLSTASHTSAIASVLTALLRTDRWKTFVSKDQTVTNRPDNNMGRSIDGLITLLIASMQQHFLSVQPIRLPLQSRLATIETAPATLLFATRSKESLWCMNDAVCSHRQRLIAQSYRGVLGEEWFIAQQQERHAVALVDLRQNLLDMGQAQRTRRWPDLRQRVLTTNFGQFSIQEYDAALLSLLHEGMLRCEWRGRPPSDGIEDSRIPGNDDTLLWQ